MQIWSTLARRSSASRRCAEPNGVQLVELTSVCVGQWPMCTHEADDDGLHALDHALACHRYDIAKLLLGEGDAAPPDEAIAVVVDDVNDVPHFHNFSVANTESHNADTSSLHKWLFD